MYDKILQEFEHRCYEHLENAPALHMFQCGVCGKQMSAVIKRDECCGPVEADSKEGLFVCSKCGRVVDGRMFEGCGYLNNQFVKDIPVTKKRCYHSGIHFDTHLKRYMGESPGDVPQTLLKELSHIDVSDRDAYFVVRNHLKSRKLSKYYKHIFRIIYELGGQRPKLEGWQKDKLVSDYKVLQTYFYENSDCFMGLNVYGCVRKYRRSLGKFKRKSMPSLSMLLDFLLKGVGHVPYYRLPYLKDEDLRHRVYEFFKCHRENLEKSFELDARGNNNL